MKLAEALQERADLNRKIAQLRSRISDNVMVQEGEAPAEDPAVLVKQLNAAIDRLEVIMREINYTNNLTVVEGSTLTDLIAKRDCLTLRLSAYRQIVSDSSQSTYRARNTEIKIVPTVKAAEFQKLADDLAARLRVVDNTIQRANWDTDLIEK